MKRFLAVLMALALLNFMTFAPALADVVEASTPLTGASNAQRTNIELAAEALNGTYVEAGDAFSFNDVVGPRTAARGYKTAVNGRGVNAMGGGAAQVASSLYLALKQMSGIAYLEKRVYGSQFAGDYVSSGSDAIITDYDEGIDFRFRNDSGEGLYISLWWTGSELGCSVAVGGDAGEDGIGDPSGVAGYCEIYVDGTGALKNNVDLAAYAVSGAVLAHGDVFSFNDVVGPRTAARGYQSAVNGRGVKVIGGGVAQVASALWLAIKDIDSVTVLEKSTYGSRYNQSYVADEDDAIMTDYAAGSDFRFRYDGYGQLSIYAALEGDTLVCEIYED